jgi:hypothetical protein
MNVGLIMGGIVKAAEDLTEFRVQAENPTKEKHSDEVELSKINRQYEDDESDEDFDDADEEVIIINESLKQSKMMRSSGTIVHWTSTALYCTSSSFL